MQRIFAQKTLDKNKKMKFRQALVVLLAVASIVLILVPFGYWVMNPELSQMQVFQSKFWYWIAALVCTGWAKILSKEK